jgi:ribosome biogenesis GTPase
VGQVDGARLDRWRKLAREEAFNTSTIAERRARDKRFGRLIKNVVKEKKSRKGG